MSTRESDQQEQQVLEAMAIWESHLERAADQWKQGVTQSQDDYRRGIANFLGISEKEVSENIAHAWDESVANMSPEEFRENIQGEGADWLNGLYEGVTGKQAPKRVRQAAKEINQEVQSRSSPNASGEELVYHVREEIRQQAQTQASRRQEQMGVEGPQTRSGHFSQSNLEAIGGKSTSNDDSSSRKKGTSSGDKSAKKKYSLSRKSKRTFDEKPTRSHKEPNKKEPTEGEEDDGEEKASEEVDDEEETSEEDDEEEASEEDDEEEASEKVDNEEETSEEDDHEENDAN